LTFSASCNSYVRLMSTVTSAEMFVFCLLISGSNILLKCVFV
jgi:hypothetical protein